MERKFVWDHTSSKQNTAKWSIQKLCSTFGEGEGFSTNIYIIIYEMRFKVGKRGQKVSKKALRNF